MERSTALIRASRAVIGLTAAAAACAALATPAAAGWTRPTAVSTPTSISVIGPQVASSATGAAAVSFNEVNLDAQGIAGASVALAPAHGAFSVARAIPGVQEVLAIAYSGSTLELLTASGPPGQPCCSTVQVIRRGAHAGFGAPQTIVSDAGGGTTGSLVPLANGRMLAVIAGPQRLWATEARGTGRFGALRGLTRPGSAPAAIAVTGTADGGSAVLWTQGAGGDLFGASAGPGATPSRRRTLLALAGSHAIDGVQLAAQPDGLTLAWTESWSDAAGRYHAEAMAADVARLGQRLRPRALSASGDVVSGLELAGDAEGAEVAAWQVCAPSSTACVVESRSRPAAPVVVPRGRRRGRARGRPQGRWFGSVSRLGAIDPGDSPELAIAPGGGSVLGWITGGRVALASMRPGATRFAAPRRVSGGLADNLVLGYGPTGEALSAWTQGTVAPTVFVTRSG